MIFLKIFLLRQLSSTYQWSIIKYKSEFRLFNFMLKSCDGFGYSCALAYVFEYRALDATAQPLILDKIWLFFPWIFLPFYYPFFYPSTPAYIQTQQCDINQGGRGILDWKFYWYPKFYKYVGFNSLGSYSKAWLVGTITKLFNQWF